MKVVSLNRQPSIRTGAMQKVLAFASLILLVVVFSLASSNFFRFDNLVAIILSTAVIGVLALGSTFVIITSGIDLSVGTVMTFASVMTGVIITTWQLPMPLGIIGGILTGAVCGLLSGLAVAKLKIPPFIATLAMMMITKGLSLVISGTKPIYFNDAPLFMDIAMGSVIGAVVPGFDIPNAVLIFFGLAVIASIILSKTIIGRFTFALGSNEEATRLSGVNVDKWKIIIYTITGAFSGIAGILMASRLNSAQPALGAGYELEAIAAVVIGGTSLSGGQGSILGTVIGALIMSVLTNGLRILSVPQEWQTVIVGLVVILAVYADMLRRRKK
ncbi:ABC transporter permease [Paenibacillus mucilaginosus]|uniref:Inner-membrane translocator n=3 Tax=Paenibacillus mucilaginosus TaxID=61624 RepID=H6NPF8_9BACL|nr:ABC transporter permease [Paenibacillus mucilaginosus]AEI44812.1 inner-membrane translocator [Paenibacillus mucilaginosus KNP414]AFC32570.1 inner-membrane translocator [Paenibacillus mucilaginosus 3016]AFH64892.1 ribose ABC transporter permease [Paenibacillus mucilaginosus K02]MCG7214859.1 ABC transporter permease [Paenibacillus mucilaginosus]WDM26340.1 ABC transporter permease [Paenibacillus mucilaginosus]